MKPLIAVPVAAAVILAWSNGPAGNATTNLASECSDAPYATHDWIADHALALLLANEAAWLQPHRTMYLLGTEAPDNDDIPAACGAPNTGYDDSARQICRRKAVVRLAVNRSSSGKRSSYDNRPIRQLASYV